jgi:hypothetical protein
MSDYEKFVPIEIRETVDGIAQQARINLERDGCLVPVAFVGRLGGDFTVCGNLARIPKEAAAQAVRALAKKQDADFVLWLDEAWLKAFTGSSKDEARRKREQYGGEVRDIPGRVDVVMFVLHTHAGVFVAQPLREEVEGKYTFGAVTFEAPMTAEGRVMSLLPPRETKQ